MTTPPPTLNDLRQLAQDCETSRLAYKQALNDYETWRDSIARLKELGSYINIDGTQPDESQRLADLWRAVPALADQWQQRRDRLATETIRYFAAEAADRTLLREWFDTTPPNSGIVNSIYATIPNSVDVQCLIARGWIKALPADLSDESGYTHSILPAGTKELLERATP